MKAAPLALSWAGAAVGAVVPCVDVFVKKLVPPLFPEFGYLTGAAAAIVIGTVTLRYSRASLKTLTARAFTLVIVALVVLASHLFCLRAWTLQHPLYPEVRYQIGFRTALWSLTPAGVLDVHAKPNATPEDLMQMEGAYTETNEGPFRIWKTGSIYTAAAILLSLYLAGFVAWSAGFTYLAVAKKRA
jgi:hypothetical protein